MRSTKILPVALIFILILTGAAFGKINKNIVLRAWQKITAAEKFPELPINFELDSDPNAWVAYDDEGNYSVHVTSGLMKILETESEIAGVLAHELGHIQLGHYNNFALSETVQAIMGANIERADDLTRAVGKIDMELKESSFSREQETEADNYGVKTLVKANYSAWGLYNAMKRLENNFETEDNSFNSHPASKERLENLARQAKIYKKNYCESNEIDNLANILMGK